MQASGRATVDDDFNITETINRNREEKETTENVYNEAH